MAGDDAAEAAFVPFEEALQRVDWSETRRIIRQARDMAAAQDAAQGAAYGAAHGGGRGAGRRADGLVIAAEPDSVARGQGDR